MLTNGYLKVAEVSALGQKQTKMPRQIYVCLTQQSRH